MPTRWVVLLQDRQGPRRWAGCPTGWGCWASGLLCAVTPEWEARGRAHCTPAGWPRSPRRARRHPLGKQQKGCPMMAPSAAFRVWALTLRTCRVSLWEGYRPVGGPGAQSAQCAPTKAAPEPPPCPARPPQTWEPTLPVASCREVQVSPPQSGPTPRQCLWPVSLHCLWPVSLRCARESQSLCDTHVLTHLDDTGHHDTVLTAWQAGTRLCQAALTKQGRAWCRVGYTLLV